MSCNDIIFGVENPMKPPPVIALPDKKRFRQTSLDEFGFRCIRRRID
jgi:hypothetical protein